MVRTHAWSTIGALIVCLVSSQWSGTLFASGQEPSSGAAPSSQPVVDGTSPSSSIERPRLRLDYELLAANALAGESPAQAESASFGQRGGYRGRGRGGRDGAAQAEIILGVVASIAGAAVLVYANRPECNTNQMADGCGYGTKVVGGAVLTAGIVSLVAGALTWR